jgi:2-succinyl-6-hydroxy-2,4-cyclohexadiene-1-carboxylate synthase
MPYLSSDGANLFVDVRGEGIPHLFVHGFGFDHRQWTPIEASAGGQFVALDLRGHGESFAPEHGYTWMQTARDVLRVMAQIGMERRNPGFLVAQWWSADAALQAVLAEPRAVRGVALIAPAVWGQPGGEERGAKWESLRARARHEGVAAALAAWRDDAAFMRLRTPDETWRTVLDMHAACTGRHWLSDEIETGEPTWAQLGACKVPVLILHGDADEVDPNLVEAWKAALPAARAVRVPAAGRYPSLEAPAATSACLRAFFDGYA